MIQTVEAIIGPDGKVLLLEAVELTEPRRALVTILEDERCWNPRHSAFERTSSC